MHRKHYRNGQRDFIVDKTSTNSKGYTKLMDADSKVKFVLPDYVINNFKYIFSWDRYVEERDENALREQITSEIKRITLSKNKMNKDISLKHLNKMLKELN